MIEGGLVAPIARARKAIWCSRARASQFDREIYLAAGRLKGKYFHQNMYFLHARELCYYEW